MNGIFQLLKSQQIINAPMNGFFNLFFKLSVNDLAVSVIMVFNIKQQSYYCKLGFKISQS
jgi:hypothetical protein